VRVQAFLSGIRSAMDAVNQQGESR
jgi:hypothetical protein